MLDGTPLGSAAVDRLRRKPAPPPPPASDPGDEPPEQMPPAPEPEPVVDAAAIDAARTQGVEDATAGKPVTDNPFPPHDPRRAAYDEGWCRASGSDGMDIPEAWRRSKPAKKSKPDEGDDGAEPGDDADGED